MITSDQHRIMERWLDQARRVASARGLDKPALTNAMPELVRALGRGADARAFAEAHFATRLRQGFQLVEILDEFALLARCVVDSCFELREDERPATAEIDELHANLYRASAAVVGLFEAHMREDEQTEKRYARLLQDLATAAVASGTCALPHVLCDVADLVADAMSAPAAAIVVRDAAGRPAAAASTGGDALATHASDLADQLFELVDHSAGALWHVASCELDVSDELRAAGLSAVLGVRLHTRSGLSGLLVIGVDESREFSGRERRRLETFAEQLVVHLDGASMFDQLNATIIALETERSLREYFVSVLAHDLRGPLSAAKLGAELLVSEHGGGELGARMDRNLDRMDRMIRDLLDASRLGAGEHMPMHLERCDLRRIAQDVADELAMLHGDRLVVRGDERVLGTWSAGDLRRAVWNLCTNAIKYGAADTPIEICVQGTAARAVVSVHNVGTQIEQSDQRVLFEPFARTRASIDSGVTGWGLGLALVRRCAEAHGGTVRVASDAGDGTTFTIELPLDARPYQHHAGGQPRRADVLD